MNSPPPTIRRGSRGGLSIKCTNFFPQASVVVGRSEGVYARTGVYGIRVSFHNKPCHMIVMQDELIFGSTIGD
jgi:hypothetical protein